MIRISVTANMSDDCDMATIAGTVRRALLASAEFTLCVTEKGHGQLMISYPTEEDIEVDITPL